MCEETRTHGFEAEVDGAICPSTVTQPLSPADLVAIRRRLQRIHQHLAQIHLQHVDQLTQTIAGKTRRFIRQAA